VIRTLLLTTLALVAGAAMAQSIVGVDHVPVVVRDLDAASATYRDLGFVFKPGRLHDNSISNNHAKYPDGTEIELITASRPVDELARKYIRLAAEGEGAAFLALHCRDFERLPRRLKEKGMAFRRTPYLKIDDPSLDYLFFVRDNRSSTDRPEHFAHPNTTTGVVGVWLADAENESLLNLLRALGAPPTRREVGLPMARTALVSELTNGRIILLPRQFRLLPDRPIIGVVLRATDFQVPAVDPAPGTGDQVFIEPTRAHGLWIAIRRPPL
jgi:hypothetical protein